MLPSSPFSPRLIGIALVLPALLVIALCFIAPLGLSVRGAFISEQGVGSANFVTAFTLYLPDILFTLLIVSLATVLIGLFYQWGLNGTVLGVVLVHTVHGLVFAVWIAAAAFAAIEREMEQAARSIGAGAWRTFTDITLPLAFPGLLAAAIFVFLESLDEFTGSYFVGAPDVQMMPLLLYTAGSGGNYQIASITVVVLLIPSLLFMLVVERFLKADVLARIGK